MRRSSLVMLSLITLCCVLPTRGGVVGFAAAASTKPNPPWKGLPTRTTTQPHSGAGDVINVALEGTRDRVLADFGKIGWVKADPLSPRNDARLAVAALHHGKYPKAPVSKQFLFGRLEDFAVEKEGRDVSQRDHARFWDTGKQDSGTHLELWIGAASKDIGIKIVHKHHLLGTTHRIDGHIDNERNLIVSSMQKAGVVQTVVVEPGIGHVTNIRTGGGDLVYTDGKVDLVVLK